MQSEKLFMLSKNGLWSMLSHNAVELVGGHWPKFQKTVQTDRPLILTLAQFFLNLHGADQLEAFRSHRALVSQWMIQLILAQGKQIIKVFLHVAFLLIATFSKNIILSSLYGIFWLGQDTLRILHKNDFLGFTFLCYIYFLHLLFHNSDYLLLLRWGWVYPKSKLGNFNQIVSTWIWSFYICQTRKMGKKILMLPIVLQCFWFLVGMLMFILTTMFILHHHRFLNQVLGIKVELYKYGKRRSGANLPYIDLIGEAKPIDFMLLAIVWTKLSIYVAHESKPALVCESELNSLYCLPLGPLALCFIVSDGVPVIITFNVGKTYILCHVNSLGNLVIFLFELKNNLLAPVNLGTASPFCDFDMLIISCFLLIHLFVG
ncbi:hypothetical protein ACJX0J_024797 [Zea mays]